MNQKGFINIVLIIVVIAIVAIGGHFLFFKKFVTPIGTQQSTQQSNETVSNFQYGEVIKEKIGVNGGILQNAEKSVIVTIPPLEKETEFTLSFKKSDFEVRSGVRSPVTINIYPDINLMDSPTPVTIKVKYDEQYNLPVGYLIDEKNKLHAVDSGEIDRENHYFIMLTFHSGNYSWIYAD